MLIVLPDELEALRSMQPLDRDVFYYLVERVDYETGTIGVSRRVSYGGMAYDLTEYDIERRSRDRVRTVTSKQVENCINRLINAGLLERHSQSGMRQNLLLVRVFWAAAVGKGNCAKKPDGRLLGELLGVIKKLSTNTINELQQKEPSSWEAKFEAVGTTSNIQQQQQEAAFLMFSDWTPTQDEFEMSLFRAGYSADKVNLLWMSEFVDHWRSEGRTRQTQAQWTKKLAYKVIAYLRDPGMFDRLHGVNQPARSGGQAKAANLPEWAVPPKEDHLLNGWMRKHGYGDGPPGFAFYQMRQWLQSAIEGRLKEWRKLS
jgi:hypothetical protein